MNESTNDTNEADRGYRPSRRTMLAAAAWSVPVVVVAQAAPALAQANPSDPVPIEQAGRPCKFPGSAISGYDKGYALGFSLTNNTSVVATLNILSFTVVGQPGFAISGIQEWLTSGTCEAAIPGPAPFNGIVLAPGEQRLFSVFTTDFSNSANTSMTITYNYTLAGDPTVYPATALGTLSGDTWTSGCRNFTPWPQPPCIG